MSADARRHRAISWQQQALPPHPGPAGRHVLTKVEGHPGLTGDGSLEAVAHAGTWACHGWVLVGGGAPRSAMTHRDPVAWTSADGLTWSRQEVPGTQDPEDMQIAMGLTDGRVLALGLSGGRFAAWTRDGTRWARSAESGSDSTEWRGTPYVASVVETPSAVLATVSTAEHHEPWSSVDTQEWIRVEVPAQPSTASDHILAVAAAADALLLVVDDGQGGCLYTAPAL